MQPAQARALHTDDYEAAEGRLGLGLLEPEEREAVLLQWEAKIESAERSPGARRFVREEELEATDHADADRLADESADALEPGAGDMAQETSKHMPDAGGKAPQALTARPPGTPESPDTGAQGPERRTVMITGRPQPARRRATTAERHIASRPDSIALWAFLLGLLLVAVAAGSAHA